MLSSHELNDIVDRLREWLVESNESLTHQELEELVSSTRDDTLPNIGLLEVAEAFTALRHETKLYTKSVRALNERVEQGLHDLGQSNALLQEAQAEVKARGEAQSRQMLSSLLDIDEALDQALHTCNRGRNSQRDEKQALLEKCQAEFYQLPGWRRALANFWHERLMQTLSKEPGPTENTVYNQYESGLLMLKTKLLRTLAEFQVIPIESVGMPLDPSRMRIVATVVDTTREPDTVVEQIRPGYLRNGQVFRPAEVKVVKH